MNKDILKEDIHAFAENFPLYEQLKEKTFVITGATGLIGSVMVRCLVALEQKHDLGLKVVAVVRNLGKARTVFADVIEDVDIREVSLNNINAELIGSKADYIAHLASPTASKYFLDNPVETLRTSIDGTEAMLEYAKDTKAAMVYASSLESYGSNNTDEWLTEDFQGYVNPVEVRSSYNIGKRASECLCHAYAKEYGVNVTIARLTQTFGAGVSAVENRVFAQFARKAINGENIVLHTDGQSAKPYIYTTDAISALLYLLLRGEGGEAYNVANSSTYISIKDMAQMVVDHFAPQVSVKIIPTEGLGYAPFTKLHLDTRKIESLGWSPRYGLVEMFNRLIQYIR